MGLRRILTAHLIAAAIIVALLPSAATAQTNAGITVVVTALDTQNPVEQARIHIAGPVTTGAITDARGTAQFQELPPGRYVITALHPRYAPLAPLAVELKPGSDLEVDIRFAALRLHTIGAVRNRSRSASGAEPYSIGVRSPAKTLGGTLNEALTYAPGVDGMPTYDALGRQEQQLRLEGHDASQTSVSIDGVPLSAPGLATDISALAADVFAGANVSFDPRNGSLAGGVDFRTAAPALRWVGTAGLVLGSTSEVENVAIRGSVGRLGVVAARSANDSTAPGSGRTFADWSGVADPHAGGDRTSTNLLKLQGLVGSSVIVGVESLASERTSSIFCILRTTTLPCGYGPGNESDRGLRFRAATATAAFGEQEARFAVFSARSTNVADLSNRRLESVLTPTFSATERETWGGSFSWATSSARTHQLSVEASYGVSNTSASLRAPGIEASASYLSHLASYSIADRVQLGRGNVVRVEAGHTSYGIAAGNTAGIAWTGTRNGWSINARSDVGQVSGAGYAASVASGGTNSLIDCANGISYGSSGLYETGPQSSRTLRLTISRTSSESQFGVSAFDQFQRGASIVIPVPLAALDLPFADAFVAATNGFAAHPNVCGGRPFTADDIYLNAGVRANVHYQGLRFNGSFGRGALLVQPYGLLLHTVLSGADVFSQPGALYTTGSPVPGAAYASIGAIGDYRAPKSTLEALVAARYVSGNNALAAKPFALVDIAFYDRFQRGWMTLQLNNVGNALAQDGAYADGVVRLTASGRSIPQIRGPFRGRALRVSYSLPVGGFDKVSAESRERQLTPGSGSAQPAFVPLFASPPAEPFALRNSSPACTFERARFMRDAYDALAAYVRAIEQRRAGGDYPASSPVPPPVIAGFLIRYHSSGASYSLVLNLTDSRTLAAFTGCSTVHIGEPDELARRGLFAMPVGYQGIPFLYSPAAGIYYTNNRRPNPPARIFALDAPNPQPFALTSAPSCSTAYRQDAERVLPELQRVLDTSPATVIETALFTITPKHDAKGTWYALDFPDLAVRAAVYNCGHVSSGTAFEFEKAGQGYSELPSMNYSSKLGIFIHQT